MGGGNSAGTASSFPHSVALIHENPSLQKNWSPSLMNAL